MENTNKILIIDDHPLIRDGIRLMLSTNPEFEVIGECEDAETAHKLIKEKSPDIILMDISLPGKSGIEIMKELSISNINSKIIVLSSYLNEQYILKSLEFNVNGYVLKSAAGLELVDAIKQVISGENYFSKNVEKILLKRYTNKLSGKKVDDPEDKVVLTKREDEILRLIGKGLTSPQIAEKLFISDKTVNTHRNKILKKFNVNNSMELIRKAIAQDILTI